MLNLKNNEDSIQTNGQCEFNRYDTCIKVKTKEIEDKEILIKKLERDMLDQNKISIELEMILKNERDSFDIIFNNTNNEINLNQLENKDLENKYLELNNTFNSLKREYYNNNKTSNHLIMKQI